MTEYYITSELGYARFAILHGFEGCETETARIGRGGWANRFVLTGYEWRFPKTPHNVAMEVHRENDICKQIMPSGLTLLGTVDKDWSGRLYVDWMNSEDYDLSAWTIIERNNQPFPVWDKETI